MRKRTPAAPHRDAAARAHRVIVRPSPIHGLGVFAARRFGSGEFILRPDESRVLTDTAVLPEAERKYRYDLPGKSILWLPPERYVNHSCEPNAYVKTVGGVRVVLAMREIKRDEEITLDYRLDGFSETQWDCSCGSKRCNGVCDENFFRLSKALQLEYLPCLDDWFVEEFREQVDALRRETLIDRPGPQNRRTSRTELGTRI